MNVQRQSGANKIRPNPITSHMAKKKKNLIRERGQGRALMCLRCALVWLCTTRVCSLESVLTVLRNALLSKEVKNTEHQLRSQSQPGLCNLSK